MSQEKKLLTKLNDFFSKKYSDKSLANDKFSDAALGLVKDRDVKIASYIEFCNDNDITPKEEPVRNMGYVAPPINYDYDESDCNRDSSPCR